MATTPSADRYLGKPAVAALLGVGTRTLDRWVERGDFPPPLVIGPRLCRWREQVVLDYLREREDAGRAS